VPNYYTKCFEIFTKSDIKSLWAETSYGTNLQYDQFQNTKQVLKAVQHEHEDRIKNTLLSQGLVISSILKFLCQTTSRFWSTVQQNMPRNIFNFSIKYLNNTLPTRKKPLQMVHFSIVSMFILPSIRNVATRDI